MSIAWLEVAGLRFEGVSDATIRKLDSIQPDIDHLALVLRAEMPRLARIAPVLCEVVHEVIENQKRLAPQPVAPAPAPKPAAKPQAAKKFF